MTQLTHLNDLHAFVSVAKTRSFRRAAAEIGVTPSALSHTMRTLEARLGVRLLNRSTRSVSVTEVGERLLARLTPALSDIAGALDAVNEFRHSPTGLLRINAPHAACDWVLGSLLLRFLKKYPGIRVELVTDDSLVDIVAQGFDAGVRFGEALALDMVAIPLGPAQRFVVVGSPAYLLEKGYPTHPSDLIQHQCIQIRFPSGRFYRWEFSKGHERVEVEVSGALTLDYMRLMVQAAEEGLGLAFVYTQYASAALSTGQLVTVLDEWHPPEASFFLYYPRQRLVPAALRAFIDWVKETNPTNQA